MHYPMMTESRVVCSLDGIWKFKLLAQGEAYDASRPLAGEEVAEQKACPRREQSVVLMPVPCSYNDIYEGRDFRNHVGGMVYERTVQLSAALFSGRLLLRFGSVTHRAKVYVNGVFAAEHSGGFLPFEVDIRSLVRAGENRITVLADNVVDESTLPCGRLVRRQFPGLPEEVENLPNFGFYNYSGIMRPVVLYTTPETYIRDIVVAGGTDGVFSYEVSCGGPAFGASAGTADETERFTETGAELPTGVRLTVEVLAGDGDDTVLFCAGGSRGSGKIEGCRLWSTDEPYLYRLRVTLTAEGGLRDVYTEEFGFREFCVREGRLWLNGARIYLKGFGKHEDAAVHGRGFCEAYNVKDIGLMKWMGANSFRTSHYPYSEEMMRLCDREGILVIDEVPAVGLHTGFTATGLLGGVPHGTWSTLKTAEHHAQVLRELIARDKNHPCVIAFSIANEPASEEEGAREYFAPLFALAREADPQHRPLTVVTYGGATPESCKVSGLCDFLMINRYNGWYDTEGNLRGAAALLSDELERFHRKYPDKPIVFGEFGADAVAGLHDVTGDLFSEEYQEQFIRTYCELFDTKEYVCGEHVWNFADFATAENIKRVQGNKKGVFTRERRPKKAVWYLRERWTGM